MERGGGGGGGGGGGLAGWGQRGGEGSSSSGSAQPVPWQGQPPAGYHPSQWQHLQQPGPSSQPMSGDQHFSLPLAQPHPQPQHFQQHSYAQARHPAPPNDFDPLLSSSSAAAMPHDAGANGRMGGGGGEAAWYHDTSSQGAFANFDLNPQEFHGLGINQPPGQAQQQHQQHQQHQPHFDTSWMQHPSGAGPSQQAIQQPSIPHWQTPHQGPNPSWQPPASMASSQASSSSSRDDLQAHARGSRDEDALLFLPRPDSLSAHFLGPQSMQPPSQHESGPGADALAWFNAQQQQSQSAFGAGSQASLQRPRRPEPLHLTADSRTNGGQVGGVGNAASDLSNVPLEYTPMPADSRTPRGDFSNQPQMNQPSGLRSNATPAFNYMLPPFYEQEQSQTTGDFSGSVPMSASGSAGGGGQFERPSTSSSGQASVLGASGSTGSIPPPQQQQPQLHPLQTESLSVGSTGSFDQLELQGSTLSQVYGSNQSHQSPAGYQQNPSQFINGSDGGMSGSPMTGQHQRSSTMGQPPGGLKHEQGYPPFLGGVTGRSHSSDGNFLQDMSGQMGGQIDFSRYGGPGGEMSFAGGMMTQSPSSSAGPHGLHQHQQHHQQFSGMGEHPSQSRDSEAARLSLAMANTQLAPSREHPQGTTPTIMEEEEEGQLASSRGPTGKAGGRGGRTSQQQQQQLQLQRPQIDLEQQRASFFATQQLNSNQQIQVQRQQPSGPSAPTVLQRRYKPAVRPSTYQQLSTMNVSEEEERLRRDPSSSGSDTFETLIDEMIRHYITSPSRLGLGERTVLIMTSKVAQKSYGAEKRFLCPPPMVLLIGSSWWHACKDPSVLGLQANQRTGGGGGAPTTLIPPRVNIGMSGETNNQEGVLEWATSSGRLIDVGNPSSEMAVSGRCIGKQLYITDVDEKRRSCETLVRVSVPGKSPVDAVHLGTFASKPIKIISKPSKKRQSNRNTELGIQHGSIVSLFHRLRSQTVSTRYLCVSGAPTWFKGSDGQPFLTLEQHDGPPSRVDPPSCFVAKMTSWDPFVVYLVDPNKKATDPNVPPSRPPVMGYPPPPPSAMVVPPGSPAPTVHYNQRIVLQCLNTAVVSPIMVIRKVDKATTVTGGSAAAGSSDEEALGDPVSQLHKIALEVVEDPDAPAPSVSMTATGEPSTPGASGPFLACLNESVGMRRPLEQRKWVWSQMDSMPSTPLTPAQSQQEATLKMASNFGMPPSPTAFAAAYAAAQTRSSMAQSRQTSGRGGSGGAGGPFVPPSPYVVPQQQQASPQQSSDGGKVKRPRRVSSSIVPSQGKGPASTPGKGRRRGQSLSMVEWQKEQARQWQQQQQAAAGGQMSGSTSSDLDMAGPSSLPASASASESSVGAPSGAAWTVDIADSDVWTIVGTDIARHTFYIPPRLAGGVGSPTNVPDSGIAHLIATPAPSSSVTPLPVLHSFMAPSNEPGGQPFVTLYGENFSDDLYIYFGDWRSTTVQLQSSDTLLCSPPPPASEGFDVPTIRLPVILVRKDGVIFPSECIYSA